MKQLLTGFLIMVVPLIGMAQTNITANIQFENEAATGQYQDFLATGQNNYVAPILILEANDIDNTGGINETKSIYDEETLFQDLRNDGFDITILVFDDFTTYIQRNAFLVVKMLNVLKGRTDVPITILASGASGIMAHYAVRYMEDNSIAHNVERIITIDAPFNGWQYPLGAQLYLDDIANVTRTPIWSDLVALRDFQKSKLNHSVVETL